VLLNVDDKGRIKKLSPSLEEFLGQSSEQLENLDASNLVFRTDVGQFKRLLDQVKYQTGSTDGSFRLRNTFNDVVYFDWTAACIGADILLIGRSSNIHLEEALLKSEERINNILESMDDAFFAIDMNGYVNYLNEKVLNFWVKLRRCCWVAWCGNVPPLEENAFVITDCP